MSDLPSLDQGSLQRLFYHIDGIRRAKSHGRSKPHKLVLLLAAIDLVEKGVVTDNKFFFGEQLIRRFNELFAAVAQPEDWRQVAPPFFHLKSDGFWIHVPREGRELDYSRLKTSGGGWRRILENIDHAEFVPWAWEVVVQEEGRRAAVARILSRFFSADEAYRVQLVLHPEARIAERGEEHRR